MGLITWVVYFSSISWAQDQECVAKTSYDSAIACSNDFYVARNPLELARYLRDSGLSENKYRNLRIAFDVDRGTALNVHSPCSIEIINRTSLSASSICLDARKDIKMEKNLVLISDDLIKLISQRGNIRIKGRTAIVAPRTDISALGEIRVRTGANITAQGSVLMSSNGTAQESFVYFGKNSSLTANSLTIKSIGEITIGPSVSLSLDGALLLTSSGQSAFAYTRIQRNVTIDASQINMTSQNRASVRGATLTGDSIEINGKGCSISSETVLNSSNKTGSCFEQNANRYPVGVELIADSTVGAAPLAVNFSARAEDIDGSIASYQWDFGDGSIATGITASHNYSSVGEYVVTLVVADDSGAKVPAQVDIQVGGNLPPMANAGQDMRIELGTRISLSGAASSDPEGETLSYAWEITTKPIDSMVLLAKPETEMPFFVPDVVGEYNISLIVSDGVHFSSADAVTISVFRPPNAAPTLSAIGDKTVVLGSELKFTVSGSDSDGDTIDFRATPSPLLENARFNGQTGEFIFHPKRSQVGAHNLTFFVSDGRAKTSEKITITVTAPTSTVTGLSGRVLDTNAMTGSSQEIPIVGATVSLLASGTSMVTGKTDAQGNFSLNAIPASDLYILKIDSSTATDGPGGVTYADFIEPLGIIQGAPNVISRPFFLPRIDVSSSTTVVADEDTEVVNTALGVELSIPSNAIVNDDGTTFTGNITVSEVPNNLAPSVSLPEEFDPSVLITIQPAGIRFNTPAAITFPNNDELPAGAEVNIYSIDPDSGVFVVTGTGRVNADGTKIETISGGIRGATWHYTSSSPPDIEPDDDNGNDNCEDSGCEGGCEVSCPEVGSSSPVSRGYLLESYNLVTYRSLGEVRSLTLAYNSNSAAQMPIVEADAILQLRSVPRYVSARVRVAGEEKPGRFYTLSRPLIGNIRRVVRQKIFYDASELTTGLYPYELLITAHYPRSSVTGVSTGKAMIVNQRDSEFGAGWSLGSHHQLYIDDAGDIILRFGNSDLKRFIKQADGSFLSPRGDYSILKFIGDKYERTLKDGTKYIFNDRGIMQEIRDRNDNITLYCYRENSNQLKYIEDPAGNRTHFAYNSEGKVESITDPAGRVTRLSYDSEGSLVLITAPDLTTRRFQYNSEHLLTGQELENGSTRSYIYDGFRRLSESIYDHGATIEIDPVSVDTIENVMSGQGTLRRPLPVIESINVKGEVVDRNGNQSSMKVNEFGAMTERVNALGQTTRIERDENNNPTRVVDAAGRTSIYEYDDRGNLLTSTDSATGAITTRTYESKFNRVTSTQDPKGGRTLFNYDDKGNLTKITDPNGQERYFTYNVAGQLETQTDSLGNVTKFFYDEGSGHLMAQTDPLGNVTRFTYDASGNVITTTDASGNITRIEYDLMNRATKVIDAKDGETIFGYDVSGNVINVTDAEGNTTTFTYDRENRLIARSDPLGRESLISYDNEGNIIELVNKRGESIYFEYDSANRLVRKTLGQEVVSYRYDAAGNLIYVNDADSTLRYTYNSRDQVISVSTAGSLFQPSVNITYNYDLNGNRVRMSAPFGNIIYAYDRLDRLMEITEGGRSFSYDYDNNSRLVSKSYPNGINTQYSYDSASRILDIQHNNAERDGIARFSYVYDERGNRVQKNIVRPGLSLNSEIRYVYDKLNQLISATNPQPNLSAETFTYDKVGNRLKRDGETEDSLFNENNQLVDDKTYAYSYDLNGNLIEKRHKVQNEVTFYVWDREDRLVQIFYHQGDSSQEVRKTFYRYDGLGRRIEKRVKNRGSAANAVRYVYDNEDILMEYNKRNERTAEYVHGLGIDEPLSIERSGNDYYYHQDGLGSVIALTNTLGIPIQQYAYDSYGTPIAYGAEGSEVAVGDTPIENSYLYTGREYDKESGLYYYRARYYSHQTGRFLSEDSSGFYEGEVNVYRYVENNPVNYLDPYGDKPQTAAAALALCVLLFEVISSAESELTEIFAEINFERLVLRDIIEELRNTTCRERRKLLLQQARETREVIKKLNDKQIQLSKKIAANEIIKRAACALAVLGGLVAPF